MENNYFKLLLLKVVPQAIESWALLSFSQACIEAQRGNETTSIYAVYCISSLLLIKAGECKARVIRRTTRVTLTGNMQGVHAVDLINIEDI